MADVTAEKSMEKGFRHHAQFWLCLILTVGEFALLYCIFSVTVPPPNERIVDMMLGSYTTAWLGSLGYFYNTNFGSNNKTELIAKAHPVEVP